MCVFEVKAKAFMLLQKPFASEICKWVYRREKFHSLKERQHNGQQCSIITEEVKFMNEELEKDQKFSSAELEQMILRRYAGSSVDRCEYFHELTT